nr:MAG TPA: hypothetical protein [Caudoviricetes sp.]
MLLSFFLTNRNQVYKMITMERIHISPQRYPRA